MNVVSLKVQGLDSLQAQLLGLGAELGRKTLAAAVRRAMKPVLELAKSKVPMRTGALRDSLKLTVVKPKQGDAVVVCGIIVAGPKGGDELPPARRWHFIEFGTVKLAAHPFLRPALDQSAGQVLELMKDELSKGIERAIRRRGG